MLHVACHIPLSVILFWGTLWGVHLTLCFHGLQVVPFECPIVSFSLEVYCGMPFYLYAGKGKCCMWLVKKVEIHFAKIGFLDWTVQ